jgi:hypothetical protein
MFIHGPFEDPAIAISQDDKCQFPLHAACIRSTFHVFLDCPHGAFGTTVGVSDVASTLDTK